jgi:hypothetical protein
VAHLGELALKMQMPSGRPPDPGLAGLGGRRDAHGFADRPDPVEAAEAFLHDEELDSGIVVGRGADLRFWHLTFQEYLAAKVIASLRDSKREGRCC